MEVNSIIPFIPIAIAGLAAILIFIKGETAFYRNLWSTAASLIAFIFMAAMIPRALRGTIYVYKLSHMVGGLSLIFRADALGLAFGMVSSSMWVFVNIYAIGYMEHEHHKKRFFAFFAVAICCAFGIALAENLFTLYLFYELLSIATYPLVMHVGTPEAMKAGTRYLIYTLSGGGVLLIAIMITYFISGNLSLSQAGLFSITDGASILRMVFFLYLIGFGIKAAIMPLHHWLPSAMVAPTPVTTLLHAVAVVKAGVFGILRTVYSIYGIELMRQLHLGTTLAVIASITVLVASLIAIQQDHIKRRLAYSTISQLSLIVLAAAMLSPAGILASLIHIANHAFTKGTLFMCAGVITEETGVTHVSQMKGIAKRLPGTMVIFSIAALGMIGLPPFAGFVTEWFTGVGAFQGGQVAFIAVLVANGILDALYLLPILYTAYFDKEPEDNPFDFTPKRQETTWLMLGPIASTSAMTIVLGLLAGLQGLPLSVARVAGKFFLKG